jgi:RNA polymerase sigma-70 factor, ECF subfamily
LTKPAHEVVIGWRPTPFSDRDLPNTAKSFTSQLLMRFISTTAVSIPPLTRDAFEVEALRWIQDVYRFALSMTRDEADADDVVQDTYLRAFRSWQTFTPGSDCRRWLFTICRNVFVRSRERTKQWVTLDTSDMDAVIADASTMSAWEEGAAERFTTVDVTPAIYLAVARVPEPFRSALTIVDLDDQSYEVAAEKLGIPIGTVRSRLFRGRRLLQDQLRCHALDLGVVTPTYDRTRASA